MKLIIYMLACVLMVSCASKVEELELKPLPIKIDEVNNELGLTKSNGVAQIYYGGVRGLIKNGRLVAPANQFIIATFYGLTDEKLIQRVIDLVTEKIKEREMGRYIPAKLIFVEKENWIDKEGGVKSRGKENVIRTEVIYY